ncbi:MAG: efflux RND transporter periplasmic adaptor subunit [Pricia sp.]
MKHIFIVLAFLTISCNENAEDAHAHNADGSHVGEEVPRMGYTLWTDKTELFVEFPALIVGNPSRFAAHFTVLDGHRPVSEGPVTVSLIKDGKGIRNTADAPSSPGIFSPAIQPKEAGTYQLVFDLTTPTLEDRIVIENIPVFANLEKAKEALGTEAEDDGSIPFLKEQAWKMDFQTAPVVRDIIYGIINTSGEWMPSPGSAKSLVANADGLVDFAMDNLTEGTTVKKGQLLMTLSSRGLATNNLGAEIASTKAKYLQAKSEYERKKELYESKIVPKSEFEKVESDFLVAKSNYETLSAGVSGSGKQVRAPFDGFIKSINVSNGEYAAQGKPLVSVGTHQSRMLKTQVAPSSGLTMENVQGIWYEDQDAQWKKVTDIGGSILSIGKDVERENPLISVYAQVNEEVDMPEGSFSEVQVAMGDAMEGMTIPVNALLEDYGSYSVIAQLAGESFERRPVKIGKRNGQNVEILSGLEAGEMVVTQGAYQVKMVSMSGSTPAHGHEH